MPIFKHGDLSLHYHIKGNGPRLVFHPGTLSNLHASDSIFNSALAEHFEILSFDPRGIGQSNSPDEAPTMLDYATDLKHLMEHLGWQQAHLVGESFGGMVAQEFTINFPSMVNKLVLLVTSSGGEGGSSFPYHQHDLSSMSAEEKAAFWVDAGDLRMADPDWKAAHPEIWQTQYDMYLEAIKLSENSPDRALFQKRQLNARKGHDCYDRLSQIHQPVYICGGRHDRTAPIANQLALLERIPNARLTLFDGSHMMLRQDPLAIGSIVSFLNNNT